MSDWDITLDGENYMLVPGSYRASHEPYADAQTARQRITEFDAGQNHPRVVRGANGGDAGLLSGIGAVPAPFPMQRTGIGPAPVRQAVAAPAIVTMEPKCYTSTDQYLFIGADNNLYRWDRNVANPITVREATLSGDVVTICRSGRYIYAGYGASDPVDRYLDSLDILSVDTLGGDESWRLATFAGGILSVYTSDMDAVRSYFADDTTKNVSWPLDGKVLNWCPFDDAFVIATDAGLYRLTGSWLPGATVDHNFRMQAWGSLAGMLQESDDFAWLVPFNGRLLAWVGKQVLEYEGGRDEWRPAGLEGSQTFGAAVVNGQLYVAISPTGSTSTYELWAYSGTGWWRLESGATNYYTFPTADGAGKLLTFGDNTGQAHVWDPSDTLTALNLASPAAVSTPFLDGGQPERVKRWRKVGVEFLRVDGQPVGNWDVAIGYRTEPEASFTSTSSTSVTTGRASVAQAINVDGRALQIEISMTRQSGLPPIISAIWAEYELLDESRRRRRWQFSIHARPRGVNRAGALDSRTGQQIRDTLWSLWDDARTCAFRDVDYGANPTERDVRMIAIRESWPKPADQSTLGADVVVEVGLVEV